jgi:hypothetical protein
MAAEKEATEYSGKVVQYSGGGEKWHEWSIWTNAYVSIRWCHKVLTQDCEHDGMLKTVLTTIKTDLWVSTESEGMEPTGDDMARFNLYSANYRNN